MYKYHLRDVKWGEFNIKDYFDFYLSKGDNQADLLESGLIPLISSGSSGNGICKFIKKGDEKSEIFDKNLITVDMFGKPFFHPYKFYSVSHGRINILKEKQTISNYAKKYLIKVIEKSTEGIFSYNRMCSQKRLMKIKIMLPVDKNGNPDWHFMEEYIKERENKKINDLKEYYKKRFLDLCICPEVLTDVEWGGGVKISDFFVVKKVYGKVYDNYLKGNCPYVSTSSIGNGVVNFVSVDSENEKDLSEGNVISVDPIGGKCFYHSYKFVGRGFSGASINLLYNEKLNREIGLFLVTAIEQTSKNKASYGNLFNSKRLLEGKFKLPITTNDTLNWSYMENFIKNIEQKQIKDVLKYLDIYK